MSGGWWRGNRYWLPLVPVALVAMLAASSYHVRHFWWNQDLHHAAATARPGHAVSVDIPYEDTAGRTAHRFRVRLDGLTKVTRVRDGDGDVIAIPAGATAYRVRMSFSADPSVALRDCQLTLVDDDGHQYGNALDLTDLCVPANHPGPEPATLKGSRRGAVAQGEERPRTWTVAPTMLVARGARPAEVRVWFGYPDYVSLPLPR